MPVTSSTCSSADPYEAELARLNQRHHAVMKLGTERMAAVLETLGNPQDQFKSIHVVGTNGKGSTCAVLSSIYKAHGYRVGLFSSPHLMDVRERIQLNGSWISKADFVQAFHAVNQAMVETFEDAEDHLTYFECLNAMAFWLFAQQSVDVGIIEAGLGGRLDSTNTLKRPSLVIVTPISLDHTDRLGSTLTAIAGEKAGVFKAGCPVLSAPQASEVLEVLQHVTMTVGCELHHVNGSLLSPGNIVSRDNQFYRQIRLTSHEEPLLTSLLGRYQMENLQTALSAIHHLAQTLPVSTESAISGLQTVSWPGRMQFIPEYRLIVDGSHNEAGITGLIETLTLDFPQTPLHLGLSLLVNRDLQLLKPLAQLSQCVRITPLIPHEPERFHSPEALSKALEGGPTSITPAVTLSEFIETPSNALKLLTGSLYTAGEALRLMQPKGS